MSNSLLIVGVTIALVAGYAFWYGRRQAARKRDALLRPLRSVSEDADRITPLLALLVSQTARDVLNKLIVGQDKTLGHVQAHVQEVLHKDLPFILAESSLWPKVVADSAAASAIDELSREGYGYKVLRDYEEALVAEIMEQGYIACLIGLER